MCVYVWKHKVSLNYRIAWWLFTKLGRNKVLMTPPHICIDFWAKSAKGRIQGRAIIYQGSKFMLANSQNASWNSVLRVENIGTRKKVASSIFHLYTKSPSWSHRCFSKSTVKAVEKSKRLVTQTRCLAMWRQWRKKIMYFFKRRKEECGCQQVLCQWRGERWTKFQPQETIAIPHHNVKNCSKVGKLIASLTQQFASSN